MARSPGTRHDVAWHGGGRRGVEVVSGVGHRYRGGRGLAEVRRVFVRDLTGTHRDEYSHTAELALTPPGVVERYAERRDVEAALAEMRCYLGLGTTRGRCAPTVLRALGFWKGRS